LAVKPRPDGCQAATPLTPRFVEHRIPPAPIEATRIAPHPASCHVPDTPTKK